MKDLVVFLIMLFSLTAQAQSTVGTITSAGEGPALTTIKDNDPPLAYEFINKNHFIESVLIKLKQNNFPDVVDYPNKSELVSKRKDWAIANPAHYQLYLWAKASLNGKITITKAEYSALTPFLKKQVKAHRSVFTIIK